MPQAYVQAPESLSSCPGTPLRMDGVRSSGGGIKALTFRWGAHPTQCDRYYDVSGALQMAPPAVELCAPGADGADCVLDGGSTFVFLLTVENFLGGVSDPVTVRVQRADIPIPTITIDAPPLLLIRSTTVLTLQSIAALPSCLQGVPIDFSWENAATAPLEGAEADG